MSSLHAQRRLILSSLRLHAAEIVSAASRPVPVKNRSDPLHCVKVVRMYVATLQLNSA